MANLKWNDAVAVAAAQFKTKAEREAGWPQTMTIKQLAALQRPYLHRTEPGYKATWDRYESIAKTIVQACEKGAIQWSTETRQTPHQITRMVPGDPHFARRNVYGELVVEPRQELTWATKDVQVKVITAPAFAAWLAAQPETPSAHIAAWFEAVGVNTQPQPEAAPVPVPAPTITPPPPPPARQNTRRNLLTPTIETAQRDESDPFDTPAIWAKLQDMAEKKIKPLLGKTDEGIQWLDENDELQYLTLKMLRDRLRRQKKATQKSTKSPLVRVK